MLFYLQHFYFKLCCASVLAAFVVVLWFGLLWFDGAA